MDLGALRVYSQQAALRRLSRRHAVHRSSERFDRALPGDHDRARRLPVRRVRMFLLIDVEGRCLLERRPPSGIWGGLWSPPERDADYRVDALLAEVGCA